jgi:hypothetical protein
MKPAYKGKATDWTFSVADRFHLIQLLDVKDFRDCEGFPLKTGLRAIQVPSKTGLTAKLCM